MEEVWKKALSELKKEIPEDFFNPFIKPLFPLSISKDEETIILGVQDGKIISHLKGHYKKPLQSKLKSLMGRDVIVDFQEIPEKLKPEDLVLESKSEDLTWLTEDHTFDNFLVSSSNEFAFSACKSILISKKTSNLLFISGKSGLGKTHLIQATAIEIHKNDPSKKMYYSTAQEFKEQFLNSLAHKKIVELKNHLKCFDILILEDIQMLGKSSESTQEEFFYLFNNYFEKRKTIILSADVPVSEIPISERLKSRFLSGITVEINMPDFQLRQNFIKIKNKALNLDLSEDVISFLARNITNNIRMLDSSLKMIQFLKTKGIDTNNIRILEKHLKGLLNPSVYVPLDTILEYVSGIFSIRKEDLLGKSRKAEIALPRHLAMYLGLKLSGHNKSSLARFFKKSDHTIIINAEKKIARLSDADPSFSRLVETCIENLWKNRG